MNCSICSGYLASKYAVKGKGIKIPYFIGFRPRDKKCAFLKKRCNMLLQGTVRYFYEYECDDFTCLSLQHIDNRYRSNFRMSMIENLEFIKDNGMTTFLKQEANKWKCPECGAEICCHNVICFNCGLDKLAMKKNRYRWEDDW